MEANQIGSALLQGLASINDAFLEHRRESAQWRRDLDKKIDHNQELVLEKLAEVCDKGGKQHDKFKQTDDDLWEAVRGINTRLELQEARNQGRADVLGPVYRFAKARAGVLLIVAYMCWDQVLEPMLAHAARDPAATVAIEGAL